MNHAIERRVRLQRTALSSLLAAAVLLISGCSDSPADAPTANRDGTATSVVQSPRPEPLSDPAASPPTSNAAPTAPGLNALLIARENGIVVRSMSDGTERLIKPAEPPAVYAYPRWSPDGRRIAYVSLSYPTRADQQDWGTKVVLLDGTNEQVVFQRQQPGMTIDGLAWTAAGSGLYLAIFDPSNGALTLELLDLASGSRTTIAADAAFPTASPDGRRIAFLTFGRGGERGGLWTANSDGADKRLLLAVPGPFAVLRAPRFSPDGAWLAFSALEPALVDVAAPTCPSGRRWPWQPRIAAAHGPPIGIWAMPADGGAPRRVSDLVEDDPVVAWSPSGADLAVLGGCGLYRIGFPGGAVQKLGPGTTFSQVDWR